jgi:ribosome maturation factor RimP
MATSDELIQLLGPVIERQGYELADLELKVGSRDGVLRVFIDKPGGVGLEDCELISRQVSALLDVEDPVPGRYSLEVSSPGLDRKLTKPLHFQRFVGEEVKVETRFPVLGRRRFRGVLQAADEKSSVVVVDREPYELQIDGIETARLVPRI